VVGVTHRLADRPGLASDLDDAPDYDVLLTEIKGAAIEVAARRALEEGREVAFVSNELVGDGIEEVFRRVVERAL
jgi:cyclic 2,3-diphosphoglycerate synthetase